MLVGAIVALIVGNVLAWTFNLRGETASPVVATPVDVVVSGQGTATLSSSETLVGSSISLGRLASSTVLADSITADGWKASVDQLVETNKLDNVFLNIMARGGTATSTLFARQMGSQDGVNYFDIATSTADRIAPTSTIVAAPLAIQWDPGTSTTSLSIPFETYGFRYTRFIISGEDVQLDTTDGTFAWIQAIKPEPLTR